MSHQGPADFPGNFLGRPEAPVDEPVLEEQPMIVDSHQHFWRASRGEYHWMDSSKVPLLCRHYLPDDLRPQRRRAGVDCTILVQAAQTVAETEFLLDLAESTDLLPVSSVGLRVSV